MLAQPQTFPCPNCKEIINDSMERCRYCAAPVDPQAAAEAAALQSRVNQACSDASYLKTAALVMWALFGVSLVIPIFQFQVFLGFVATLVVVLVLIVRWQMKFNQLQTDDPDYPRAKRSKNLAFLLWLGALFVTLFLLLLPSRPSS
jgi:Ca2+/Na+ antiporter